MAHAPVLNRLVETWNQSGVGGTFSVADVGGGFHVIPAARRGVTGELERPVLANPPQSWRKRGGRGSGFPPPRVRHLPKIGKVPALRT